MVGYLTGRMGISQRDVEEAMAALFRTELALGSVSAQQQAVSQALEQPTAAAQVYVQQQPATNVDETGWREQNKRAWLWVGATPQVAVFSIQSTRGAAGVKQLLGETVTGIVGSDRWSAYNWLDTELRQLCWSHLQRDFQKLVDRQGESAQIGQDLLAQSEQLFILWHRVRDGTLGRSEFQVQVRPIQTKVHQYLEQGRAISHQQTSRTCQNLLKLEPALWTFVYVEGVEPTNNLAERCLRRAVLWRRRSFGTQSSDGSRFVERILTTVTTLRLQQRDVLDYLTAACAAAIYRHSPPSLLPQATAT
jgi:transposase